MKFILIFIILITVYSSTSLASEKLSKNRIRIEETCKVDNSKFKLIFESYSDNIDGEEQAFGYSRLWIISNSAKKLKLPKEFYSLKFFKNTNKSICDNIMAIDLGKKNILLPLRLNDRPMTDRLTAIVFNIESGKVLASFKSSHSLFDTNKRIGSLLISGKKMFSFQSWVSRTDAVMTTVKVKGKEIRATETDLVYYVELKFDGKSLSDYINNSLTWEKSKFKIYFKDKNEFLHAFGWSKISNKFTNWNTILHAKDGSIDCILPRSKRSYEMKASVKWYCI